METFKMLWQYWSLIHIISHLAGNVKDFFRKFAVHGRIRNWMRTGKILDLLLQSNNGIKKTKQMQRRKNHKLSAYNYFCVSADVS